MKVFNEAISHWAKDHAERSFPQESCGIVVEDKYIPLPNRHEDPNNHFSIDPKDYLMFVQENPIQAIVHSHTNGRDYPSYHDQEAQIQMGIPWGIVLTGKNGSNDPFWWGGDVLYPLMGREFRHGVTDCFGLVRDWYKIYRQIILPNLPREDNWWEININLLMDNFEYMGFYEIDGKDIKWGDCVIGKVLSKDYPNHCGVYIGDNQIYHHLPKRPSRIDMLGPWKKIITNYFRYKSC